MTRSKKAPPRGVLARSSRLIGLAAGLAARELSGRIAQVERVRQQVAQARQIVESLGRLKGAAMKAGQMLTLELRDYLPPEVLDVLRELQDSGHAVAFSEIESILKSELGAERYSRLRNLSREPIASASIGQVHSAEITDSSGRSVQIAIKVQFRGIADSIDSDVALLEKIIRGLLALSLKKIPFDGVFSELREVLKQETDYLLEASHLKRYRELASSVKGLVVPDVFEEFTTRRVLALSFEEGVAPEDWMRANPSQKERAHFGGLILDLYFREFFDWGFVQTDPNFGNFLFRPSSGELVLLDFGATRSYDLEFRSDYRRLILHVYRDERQQAMEVAHRLGLISPLESEESQSLIYELISDVLSMFKPENQPFDYTDRKFQERARDQVLRLVRGLEHSPPPRQLIFLHRKLGGIYALLKALRLQLDLTPYWTRLEAQPPMDRSSSQRT